MKSEISKVIVASDVNERKGIGVEIYVQDKCIAEIFRDNTNKTRTINLFEEEISLELMEKCIGIFKKEISWDFIGCILRFGTPHA